MNNEEISIEFPRNVHFSFTFQDFILLLSNNQTLIEDSRNGPRYTVKPQRTVSKKIGFGQIDFKMNNDTQHSWNFDLQYGSKGTFRAIINKNIEELALAKKMIDIHGGTMKKNNKKIYEVKPINAHIKPSDFSYENNEGNTEVYYKKYQEMIKSNVALEQKDADWVRLQFPDIANTTHSIFSQKIERKIERGSRYGR